MRGRGDRSEGVQYDINVRAFVASLDPNAHRVIYLSNPHLSPQLLYRQLLLELQEEPG